jgi:hypothetical protein
MLTPTSSTILAGRCTVYIVKPLTFERSALMSTKLKARPHVVTENITPVKAEKYLNHNKANRKLREGVVDKYAEDMRAGNWTECAAPIVFYEDGDIADGQHRLWAIIESGTTQNFDVRRNFPRNAGLNIDTGLGRTIVDNAKISGIDSDLTNEMVSIARAVDSGTRQRDASSNTAKLQLVEKHREAVKWTVTHGPRGRGIRNQCVMAAIARAWYTEADKEKLARFCKVLTDGQAFGEHESAAVALRNYLLLKKNAHLNQLFRETVLKAQNCVYYFMRNKKLMVIRTVKEEMYKRKQK